AFATKHGIEWADLDSLLERSDFVSLHLPLSPETRGLIDRSRLSRMKPGSFLINTARGGLVVETDLAAALRAGRLAGAALDVFDLEPPDPANALFAMENVLLSPHVASLDTQAIQDMAACAVRNILALSRGDWPAEAIVNPGVRDGWKWHRST